MFFKWIKKVFTPTIEKETEHDPKDIIKEAEKVAQETKITLERLSQATEEVKQEIEKNGFAPFFRYDHSHGEKGGKN